MFPRYSTLNIKEILETNHNLLLLGPRQTGKSTLVENSLAQIKRKKLIFRLQEIKTYQEVIKNPSLITSTVEAEIKSGPVLLFIDEVQKIPILLDGCQYLIDMYKKQCQVILTGSSARKLRREGTNLLPGRVIIENLHSLILPEFMKQEEQRIVPVKVTWKNYKEKNIPLEDLLIYGSLPGILREDKLRSKVLNSYVLGYLEEEIRAEALSRNLSNFSNFLELAAFESNTAPNMSKLSQEIGVSVSTIKGYFELLEDTLVTYSIPVFKKKSRKQILTTPKYIFYDLGVRNVASNISFDKQILNTEVGGKLFEQFVCLELIKRIKYAYPAWKYFFWRTNHGLEVDFIIQTDEDIIPIEIKFTDTPQKRHIKHLQIFIEEFKCKRGFLVGTFSRAQKLTDKITAIPWNEI